MLRDATEDPIRPDSFDVGGVLRSLAISEDAVWVARSDRTLVRLDADTADIVSESPIPFSPGEMLVADGSLWIGAVEGERVARVDMDVPEAVEDFRVGKLPQALALGDRGLYAAAFESGAVHLLDPHTGDIADTVLKGKEVFPSSILWAFGDLWVADVVADVVTRLPGERINVGDSPTHLAAGGGSVWVANFNSRTVSRIHPATNAPGRPILVGGKPGPMAVAGDHLWVLRPGSDSAIRIGLASGRWDGEVVKLNDAPQDIAAGHGFVWIANSDGSLSRAEI